MESIRETAERYYEQGIAHYTGRGATLNYKLALDNLEKACNMNLQEACDAYGKLCRRDMMCRIRMEYHNSHFCFTQKRVLRHHFMSKNGRL
jgi:hypothetical protein